MKKVVIIGGMAAGCKTASRLRRLMPECDIKIIEIRSFLSYGACGMPFFASGDVDSFLDLAETQYGIVRDEEFFRKVKDVEAITETEVIKIDKDSKTVFCKDKDGNESTYNFDILVLATGAAPLKPAFPVPETDKISTFHNPLDAKHFRQKAQTGQIGSAVIIGGGYIGCELAEALNILWGIETTLIEKENRLLPRCTDKSISRLLEEKMSENDINLKLGTMVEKIEEAGDDVIVYLQNGEKITADHVFLCMGIKPEVTLAEQIGLKLGKLGGIAVDENMRSSEPEIYAAGDCCEVKDFITGEHGFFPLGSLANRQGKVIADNIAGRDSKFPGAAGTISMKVYGFILAGSGISEETAKDLNLAYRAVYASWNDRPHYHPEHKNLYGKMIYEKGTQRLLGLQLAGAGEVTRYIDAFSLLISKKGTLQDLVDFEHAYTPTHSGPVNPLNELGAIAQNREETGIECLDPLDADTFNGKVIDVREEGEIEAVKFSGDPEEISIMHFRDKIDEFDKNENYLLVCQKGPRSYEAAVAMKEKGFKNLNYLGGGVQLWKPVLKEEEEI